MECRSCKSHWVKLVGIRFECQDCGKIVPARIKRAQIIPIEFLNPIYYTESELINRNPSFEESQQIVEFFDQISKLLAGGSHIQKVNGKIQITKNGKVFMGETLEIALIEIRERNF